MCILRTQRTSVAKKCADNPTNFLGARSFFLCICNECASCIEKITLTTAWQKWNVYSIAHCSWSENKWKRLHKKNERKTYWKRALNKLKRCDWNKLLEYFFNKTRRAEYKISFQDVSRVFMKYVHVFITVHFFLPKNAKLFCYFSFSFFNLVRSCTMFQLVSIVPTESLGHPDWIS